MGITLLTKEIKPKNIFYRNEVKYKDDAGLALIVRPVRPWPDQYFRGALIRWAWHHRTKSDQIDGWSVQLLYFLGGGSKENTCWKKSSCHNWELNPYILLVKQVH